MDPTVVLRPPAIADGAAMAKLARDVGSLDVNSSYAYVLWCRDFARTSVVAVREDALVGYVTGYLRPDEPSTLFVWQIAVHADARATGVAAAMLDELTDRIRPETLEATVTPGNEPSHRLFAGLARRREATVTRAPLFDADVFGEPHAPEELLRITPLG